MQVLLEGVKRVTILRMSNNGGTVSMPSQLGNANGAHMMSS